jgi:hypothetical protein
MKVFQRKPLTVDEYYRMAEVGILDTDEKKTADDAGKSASSAVFCPSRCCQATTKVLVSIQSVYPNTPNARIWN